jgi:hypothetical protein
VRAARIEFGSSGLPQPLEAIHTHHPLRITSSPQQLEMLKKRGRL